MFTVLLPSVDGQLISHLAPYLRCKSNNAVDYQLGRVLQAGLLLILFKPFLIKHHLQPTTASLQGSMQSSSVYLLFGLSENTQVLRSISTYCSVGEIAVYFSNSRFTTLQPHSSIIKLSYR